MQSPENAPLPPIHKSPVPNRPSRPPLYGEFPEPVGEMIERTSHGRGVLPRERQSFREFYEATQDKNLEEHSTQPQPEHTLPITAVNHATESPTDRPHTRPGDLIAERFMQGRPQNGVRAEGAVAEAFIGETRTSEEYRSSSQSSAKIALNGIKGWFTKRFRSTRQNEERENPFADRNVYSTDGEVIGTVPKIKV